MKKPNSIALMAIVCTVGCATAAVASAQTITDSAARQLVVHYSPATLASDAGVRDLYRRLVAAANEVCNQPKVGKFDSDTEASCRKQALASAVSQIHNARLADLSASHAKIG